jgi:GNAT superfamily N-acetyltransferase
MICRLQPEQTWSLRQQVLHPSRPWPTKIDPLDLTSDALHLGWREAGKLTGVGSICRDLPPIGDAGTADWRVRGMAVLSAYQGQGIGGKLLLALLSHASGRGPLGTAWCLGRLEAQRFYIRHGFRPISRFDVAGKGPRLFLLRPLGDLQDDQIRKQHRT